MAYTRINWENTPSTNTPINATNLNVMDAGIKENDDKLLGNKSMGSIVVDDVIGKNLFDKNDITDGYYWTSTGLKNDSSMCSSNSFIEVKPNTLYTISYDALSTIFILEYDENKTYIKSNNFWDKREQAITTSSTTRFVTLSVFKTVKDSTQLEIGTKTEYTPYKKFGYNSQESMGKIIVDDISCKNLFNKDEAPIKVWYINANSLNILDGDIHRTTYLEIEPNTTYTISKKAGVGFRVGTTTTLPDTYVAVTQTLANHNGSTITMTTGSSDKYLAITFWMGNDSITMEEMLDTIQVEKGSVATTYTPYKKIGGRTNIITAQETPTNEYIDGKRVYVKRVNFGTLPNTTTKSVTHGLTNFTPVRISGIANTESYYINLPHVATTTTGNIQIGVSATAIEITTGQDRSGFTGVVDIYYTKLTDTQSASTMSLRSLEAETTEEEER